MLSAATFAVLIEHPASPVRTAVASAVLRRLLMGLAMGATAVLIIYSRLGARSGAQMNPAVTLTFARLGRIAWRDAMAYVLAQFAGGLAGLSLARVLLGASIGDPAVNYVATLPGPWGTGTAFLAEAAISFLLMSVVLRVSNGPHARWTGLAAGALVALYIVIEAPVSGMSMNPARSFAPAVLSASFQAIWIYFAAPLIGMAAAAELFVRTRGPQAVRCAKLNHPAAGPCIFRCRMHDRTAVPAAS
jgi:aquaporin Z